MRVAVLGAGGYVGGELLRILLGHPRVTDVLATSRSAAGRALVEVHPGLAPWDGLRFSDLSPGAAARGRDAVFLALEHGESMRIMDEVLAAEPALVCDLAADFRMRDLELHETFYGAHHAPVLASTFTYALADVLGAELRGKDRLAAPGCFATAAQLALRPLSRLAGGVEPALFAVTGSSGAGAKPKATTHHPARAHNLFAYSVMSHRHEGEVLEQWRAWTGNPGARARLMTHSGPFVRGIYLTLYARLPEPVDLPDLVRDTYAGRPFVRVLDAPPELTHAVGTNAALIHAATGGDGRDAQISVAIDNLIKGAGGQAVQAMNLSLGLPEDAGLRLAGYFPC